MRIIPIGSLYVADYTIRVINALKQYWKNGNSFSCIGAPKRVNMLLYLDGMNAEYTAKSGEKKFALSGDVVYTPIGSEYEVSFEKCKCDGCTVGVNFYIFDEKGQFCLSEDIEVYSSHGNASYAALFEKTDRYSEAAVPCPGGMKAGMYEVLSMLGSTLRTEMPSRFDIIMKGISYLEGSSDGDINISEIAKLCNVSPGYFRRLFGEYARMSPREYIMSGRIEKAKLYLEYESMSVADIAARLHFTDAAYFSKIFKKKVGITPTEYRAVSRNRRVTVDNG